ncbi:MAG: prepilin-type N-terminal cleavage/methylation domain-containing protein [Deltaproteobacteria bacterium]|nr:prepilin-type N-terminal cleavage/methylation domain-containing protein [Deltaproteobacteria bacterium]
MTHMLNKSYTNDCGFTLMEVLITIVLLTVGLLGMAALTTGIINGNTHSRRLTTATTLAQDKIEDVRRLGSASMPSVDTTTTEPYNTITDYPLFKRATTTVVNSPASNMKTITITVYWDSDSHSVSLQTILSG